MANRRTQQTIIRDLRLQAFVSNRRLIVIITHSHNDLSGSMYGSHGVFASFDSFYELVAFYVLSAEHCCLKDGDTPKQQSIRRVLNNAIIQDTTDQLRIGVTHII
jgi:hypothetical protein